MIVAASAASLLAVSPMAFAGGDDQGADHGHDHGHGQDHGHGYGHGNQNSSGAVNGLNGNNADVPFQLCNNDVQGQVGLVPVQDVGENPTALLNGAIGGPLGEGKATQDSQVDNSRTCGQGTGGAGYGNG